MMECDKITKFFFFLCFELLVSHNATNTSLEPSFTTSSIINSCHRQTAFESSSTTDMPRRYPRLSAFDHSGRSVAIPLTIAPILLPHEEFTSLAQEKVVQIAEANERLHEVELIAHSNAKNDCRQRKPGELPMKKRDNTQTTCSRTQSSPSQPSCTPSGRRESSNTEISIPGSSSPKRSKRFWTSEEDEIVLCAVLMKEPGKRLVERLPHRSRSAVMQRFYLIKERHERSLREEEERQGLEKDEESEEDEEMDEIPPL